MSRVSEWVFASPTRLFVTAGAAVLVPILTISALTGDPAEPGARAHAPTERASQLEVHSHAPSPVAPAPAPTSAPTSAPQSAEGPMHDVPARRPAVRAAASYLAAFLTDRGPDREWRANLARYSTPTLARLNASVPRAAVPDARVRTLRADVMELSYASIGARLSDGTRLRVSVVLTANGWQVTEVAPVDDEVIE